MNNSYKLKVNYLLWLVPFLDHPQNPSSSSLLPLGHPWQLSPCCELTSPAERDAFDETVICYFSVPYVCHKIKIMQEFVLTDKKK